LTLWRIFVACLNANKPKRIGDSVNHFIYPHRYFDFFTLQRRANAFASFAIPVMVESPNAITPNVFRVRTSRSARKAPHNDVGSCPALP
jgi:hypothetical protein